jgi:hypothetical protein
MKFLKGRVVWICRDDRGLKKKKEWNEYSWPKTLRLVERTHLLYPLAFDLRQSGQRWQVSELPLSIDEGNLVAHSIACQRRFDRQSTVSKEV